MKRRILSLVLAVLMTAALCACGGGKTNGTKDELVVGISADLDTSLDPHVSSSSAGTREVLFNIFEGLVKPDKDGNLIPAIAEDCSVNETADAYTYTLREGVRFHNGETVKVGDIVYSLSRAAGLETGEPLVSDVSGIAAVEALDEKTVKVSLKAPDTEFNSHMTVAIIPEGSDPAANVVGTGPFRFVSRVPQDSITLEKFNDYWGEGAHVNKVTKIPNGSTGSRTYFAEWTAIKYNVKFNANGGTGTMTNQNGIKYGASVKLKANTFTRSGYTFAGWNRKADGSGTSYADQAYIKNLASTNGGTVSLYAQWKKK